MNHDRFRGRRRHQIRSAPDLALEVDYEREPRHREHTRATESEVGSLAVNILCGCGDFREYTHDEMFNLAKQMRKAAAEGIRRRRR